MRTKNERVLRGVLSIKHLAIEDAIQGQEGLVGYISHVGRTRSSTAVDS